MADFRHETDRLILREWQDGDWPQFFKHTNTPAVMRWLGGVYSDDLQAMQRERIAECNKAHGHCFWAVERKQDGELLGFCGLKRSNQPGGPQGEFEIGWRFREDSWGKGYAREAALAVRDIAFTRFDAPQIIALTVRENEASWGLMLRLGMQRDEALDFASAQFGSDTIIAYSQTREQWEALHADA